MITAVALLLAAAGAAGVRLTTGTGPPADPDPIEEARRDSIADADLLASSIAEEASGEEALGP